MAMNDAASTPSILPDVHALARRSPSMTLAEHERQPDMKRMRAYRLARVQAELRKHDYAGGFFCDPFNVRYATGTRNMAVWTSHVPARYCFVPAQGKTVLFEFRSSQHLAEGIETVGECRPFIGWYYMTTGVRQEEKAKAFARTVAAVASCMAS
jgi:Xaa-Pro aminopeptidase